MKHDRCPKCGAPVPASPAPLPPRLCERCLDEAKKEVAAMPAVANPFDAAGDADPDLDKPLTPEEYELYRRLAARYMRSLGKSGAGGRIGGRARTEAKQASSRANGRKGGRPRKPDSELKRPRRTPKPDADDSGKA